jgi:Uri superfamily endonuclease
MKQSQHGFVLIAYVYVGSKERKKERKIERKKERKNSPSNHFHFYLAFD